MSDTEMKESKTKLLLQTMLRSAGKLSLFVLVSIVLLLGIKYITDPLVSEAEKTTLMETFDQVLPKNLYDNEPLNDTKTITDPAMLKMLGSEMPVTVYRARKNGKPSGLILTAIAPNGYSGEVHLLIGVMADGRISGVRVLKHKETPGLGDKIELNKNPWILEFDGRNLRDDNDPRWAVKKDGGDFDQFTGATITPRAVVAAVKNALRLINQQGEKLYE
ncbi:electron transport complex subunit RsxG [Thiomicrorhabdus sp. ZW0627]|uniref:electron transport complex subunit RsxG n=1 Tax=Thiomicrorhabdus sp. ZW0627 TaxID=3039774 RepID=UPI002437177C|nr:electron transport complex subunit RsxG [Thiomicrorhabdus sp. ZW0627]MDG6773136.1 electron transport complex subunit RsxG [Thiomicrorhabdus sp. ZW0627]